MAGFFEPFAGGTSGGGGAAFANSGRLFQSFVERLTPELRAAQGEVEARGRNPFSGALTNPFGAAGQQIENAFSNARADLGSFRDSVNALPGLLRSSALANTRTGVADAVRAARGAAGGRGGLAFGGGAGALASRAAATSADNRSAALANTLLAANQARGQLAGASAGFASAEAQARLGAAGGQFQALQTQAGLEEQFRNRVEQFRLQELLTQGRLAQGALVAGLAGESQAQIAKLSKQKEPLLGSLGGLI